MKERLKNTKKRFVKKIIVRNKPIIIGLLFIIILGVVVVPSIFATLQPKKSIVIFSSKTNYSSKEGGSWKVTNSAEFISSNTALVTMELDTISKGSSKYKDVVFLIDTSESMTEERLSTLKSGVTNSINNILNDTNNKVGIVSFNSSATLASSLSNSKSTLVSRVNSLTKGTGTSYYQAFKQLESLLKSYTNSSTREFNVVLITDGVPSKDRPNDIALYKYLKDAYPFININGVQYEAGDKLLDEIKSVSDKQYLTKIDNFSDVLSNIVKSSSEYESFSIKERLNSSNFLVESINDIKVDYGSVELNNNVITWNLDNISSGSKAKMSFKAKLKNTSNGVYDLNNSIEVNSTIGGVNDALTSLETPVLSNNYNVHYDGNKPSDCTISGVPTDTTHKVFETVGIASAPKCSGYQFKGWDIVTDNVTKINDDYFIMPEADVTLKANWSKLNIRKSTDGTIEEGWTLYKQVKSDANSSNRYAKKYTGSTSTFTGNNDVYYYYGEATNNNVVFANYCWKIVRTTDTGGVKLLYNGVPSNGTCNNTGDASALTASQMGTSSNKVAFNTNYTSPADVGYMYNTRYESFSRTLPTIEKVNKNIIEESQTSNPVCMASGFTENNGKYTLNDDTLYCTQLYRYVSVTGKYFCLDNQNSCDTLYYGRGSGSDDSGKFSAISSEIFPITISDSYTTNSDGTYTLNSPRTIDDIISFNHYYVSGGGFNYGNYYICDNNGSTCSTVKKLEDAQIEVELPIKYGNSYTDSYDGNNGSTRYKLNNDIRNEPDSNHHYTCFNGTGECGNNELGYIYYKSGTTAYYIKLNGGTSVNDAINEMLYNSDVNKNNSTIKTAIDYWYKNNMTEYTSYLEDAVWCNDRSMSNQSTNGWNPNGRSLSAPIYFNSNNNSSNLTCTNKNDRFTVNSTNGNGALTYPVGLITRQEASLAYVSSKSPLAKGIYFWGLSPYAFEYTHARGYGAYTDGSWDYNNVHVAVGVSPAVSLRMGIEYKSGDGSSDHPYVIATE